VWKEEVGEGKRERRAALLHSGAVWEVAWRREVRAAAARRELVRMLELIVVDDDEAVICAVESDDELVAKVPPSCDFRVGAKNRVICG
jgi:hypothetical protein